MLWLMLRVLSNYKREFAKTKNNQIIQINQIISASAINIPIFQII